MDRRRFFKWLATLPLLGFLEEKAHEEESHLFDWTQHPPYTDDPKHVGELTYGMDHNMVTLNGKDIRHQMITKFKTGRDGWVEFLARDKLGNVIYNHETGTSLKIVTTGHVTYFDSKRGV